MNRLCFPLLIAALVHPGFGADVSFTAKPMAVRDGDPLSASAGSPQAGSGQVGVKITFAVSAPTDVEVAILSGTPSTGSGQANVVRHLAAGMLGDNAPEPFKKGSLSQEVNWDGKDDAGLLLDPRSPAPLSVRVSIGSRPALDQVAGWDGATLGSSVAGLAVGAGGELYVLDSDRGWGRAGLRVFGPDGKYRRTIAPYPAHTPKVRSAGLFSLNVDGETIPMVFSGHCGSLQPLFSGMKSQTMAWNSRGHLVLFSAVGTIAEHGPPRHLLALHPEGGAAEGVRHVGPLIRKPLGFMGGAGERDSNFYDHLAVSPDGEFIYFTTFKLFEKRERHAVFRVKWSDPEAGAPFLGKDGEAGSDDAHFNSPQGLAVDGEGRLYVGDRGNNRVVIFSADGKRLGQFPVEHPYEVAVHAKTGEIYVLSRKKPESKGEKIPPVRIAKFPAWGRGDMKELGRIEAGVTEMALDSGAEPARIWGSTGGHILPITEKDGRFEAGASIMNQNGLKYPMFVAGDAARKRAIVREKSGGLFALSLETGRIEALPVKGTDVSLDADGNLYVMDGYGTDSLTRYTPDGRPLPFSALGSNKMPTGVYRGYGPNMGLRGHCVRPNGEVYVIRSNNYGLEDGTACKVDVFGPDGKRRRAAVEGLGAGDCGLGVDAAGNVYVGVNLKAKDQPFPAAFMDKVSADPYVWWRKGPRPEPWNLIYYNPYLFTWGSILKFGPEGGKIWGNAGSGFKGQPPELGDVSKAPADAEAFKSSYLARDLKVAGMKWRYAGYGPVPASDTNWGDPSCICMTGHLAADVYGRVFAPNAFRFSVDMLDTAGNPIARIGRYGNVDAPAPAIAFAWPTCVSVSGGKVFVSDVVNRRIVVVKFEHAAEALCEIK